MPTEATTVLAPPSSTEQIISTFITRFLEGEDCSVEAVDLLAVLAPNEGTEATTAAITAAVARLSREDCVQLALHDSLAAVIEILSTYARKHWASKMPNPSEASTEVEKGIEIHVPTKGLRHGYVNGSIQAGVPYTGIIIGEDLAVVDEAENPNPYDKWSLDLLLEPPIAADGGRDVIEIFADNLRIKRQAFGSFDPLNYRCQLVRVVLGDHITEDTRYITSIEVI